MNLNQNTAINQPQQNNPEPNSVNHKWRKACFGEPAHHEVYGGQGGEEGQEHGEEDVGADCDVLCFKQAEAAKGARAADGNNGEQERVARAGER